MGRKAKLPSKDEAWGSLAERHGGSPVRNRRGKMTGVRIPLDPFELLVDSFTQSDGETAQTYTRGRLVYPVRDEFPFRVYKRSIFTGLGKFFGMQDIEVGQPQLDREFVVKAGSQGRITALLIRPEVCQALLALNAGRFESAGFRKRGVDTERFRQLRYTTAGVLREPARLDALVRLFRGAADHLVRSGSAWPEPAPITL